MRTRHFTSGFNDLKTEFIGRTRIKKNPNQLKLRFSFENNVLCVYDSEGPQTFLILAVHNPQERNWKIFLRNGSCGKKIIDYAVSKWGPGEIEGGVRNVYELYGFFPLTGVSSRKVVLC